MEQRQWVDRSQPEMLQRGVILAYFLAGWSLLNVLIGGTGAVTLSVLALFAAAGGAYGIANEKKVGYQVAVAGAGANLLLAAVAIVSSFGVLTIMAGMFAVALFGLLVHPQSRSYQAIWFH